MGWSSSMLSRTWNVQRPLLLRGRPVAKDAAAPQRPILKGELLVSFQTYLRIRLPIDRRTLRRACRARFKVWAQMKRGEFSPMTNLLRDIQALSKIDKRRRLEAQHLVSMM